MLNNYFDRFFNKRKKSLFSAPADKEARGNLLSTALQEKANVLKLSISVET